MFVFDTKSGSLVQRLGPIDEVIQHLTFSPDGQFLAATLGGGKGLRVWRTSQSPTEWPLVFQDVDYSHDSFGAAFDRDNNLYTVADDGYLRHYDSHFKLVTKAKTVAGKQPYSVSIHPSGDRLAVGFADANAAEVYDAKTLNSVFAVDVTGIDNRDLSVVSWSADGKRFYATGQSRRPGRNPLWVWDDGGRGARRQLLVGPRDVIWQLVPCGSGIAFGAADPAWGVLDETDGRRVWKGSPNGAASVEGKRMSVSSDGRRVAFPSGQIGQSQFLFDLEAGQLTEVQKTPNDLFEANVTGLNITDWTYSSNPKLDGKPLKLLPYEVSRALAIAPDNGRFVLGTDYRLRAYNKEGTPAWPRPTTIESTVTDLNITRDGKLLLAAYGDGTIRWHRLEDGQELLALFVHAEDQRWIAWTPKGYYAASPGGEDLIGWHVNRGWSEAADFFPATRFRDKFYRPDIVRMVLETLDEDLAVTRANAQRPGLSARAVTDLRLDLPPLVTIRSPKDGDPVTSPEGEVTVKYSVRSPSGLPITRVFALIDGLPAKGAETQGFAPRSPDQESAGELKINIPPRDVKLSLIAETGQLASEAATIQLEWEGPPPTVTGELPVLYALIIGIGDYDKVEKLGSFPAADADALAQQLQQQER
ncbi:MAG: WD40 repeat domain-containing protein, partial [Alphaproteobacteria bacterium]